ncbi:substrate-binding domain-containing protein [Dyella koreensis]|uniref:Substrate-binding domain-containing protein n=1 Tax=Dyella koreensis TaxID=311235 RepID=A0ABW8KBA9_9GAMM
MKTLAGALVLGMTAVASAANAGTTLVGGGATLPALGYGGDVTHRLIAPTSGSFLATFSAQTGNPQVSYCQTGSGAGKNILAGVSGTNVQNGCPDGPTPTGFGAATSGVNRSDLTQPNFAASDSPLSSTDYNNYVTNRSGSHPVQFPAVAGAIAIAFNKSDVPSLNLTSLAVCKIFSGKITTWKALASEPGVTGIPSNVVDGTIKVAYRSDGSGTSFGFSNHLSASCAATGSQHFVTDQAFTNAVASYFPSGLPSAWSGQSGNPAVVNQVLATDGSIGYAEAANVQGAFGLFATVDSLDPVANFADPTTHKVTINSADVVYNQAITGVDANGRPTFAAISGAPSTQCIALVKPNAYATQPSGSYPIVAVSYLLGNTNNNGGDTANVRKLLGAPYNATITAATTTIGDGQGLAFLNTSFTQSQIDGCIVN